MMLSILIPTISNRKEMLYSLLSEFEAQIGGDLRITIGDIKRYIFSDIEILIDKDEDLCLGAKRNRLLQAAEGKYLCFFDDDDFPKSDYISTMKMALATEPDVVSLRGIMTTNGENPEIFEHSLQYNEWKTTDNFVKYERYPNHLNCMRADIAKQFSFPDKNFGEDHDWSKNVHESGLLKKEYYTEKILYHYRFISNK